MNPRPIGSGVGFSIGTQAVYFDTMQIYGKSTDGKIYGKIDLQASPRTGDDTTPITASAVADTDFVEMMWHFVLTNPTSRFSSLVQWDVL